MAAVAALTFWHLRPFPPQNMVKHSHQPKSFDCQSLAWSYRTDSMLVARGLATVLHKLPRASTVPYDIDDVIHHTYN